MRHSFPIEKQVDGMSIEETEIRRALAEDEFFPVFQPIVELRTGQLAGFEALARWKHNERGVILPEEFIPWMEKYGLADDLTQALLCKSCISPALKQHALFLSINISPVQLLGGKCADLLAEAVAGTGFPMDRLVVEITESALMDDLARAQAAAHALKALNCKLALDDFGTGYSSLRHLQALPFDELKVDKNFVSSMTEKRESRKIVAAVVGLGHSLGMLTVAEGVETQDQANMLLWMGCEFCQGWLYGRPVPAEEMQRIIVEAQARSAVSLPVPPEEGAVMSLEALPAHRLAQLQAIYDGAPVGMCFLDRNLRYVSLNKRLAQMNGIPAAAHLGRTVAEVIPDFFPRIEPFLRQALQGEPLSGIELEKTLPHHGGELTVLASYQPVRDEAGEVLGVSVAVMDATHAKRTEQALVESENHFRHMMQLSPHVPWVLNTQGEVIDASSRWEEFSGQPLADALGNGWLKALHPDDVEPTRAAIRHTLETGEPIDIDYRVRPPGRDWVWMRSRGAPRFDTEGRIVSIYGAVEVNGERRVSEEMERCQLELEAAVNAVPVGIILADATDGAIVTINPRAQQILGNAVFPGQKLAEYTRQRMLHADGAPFKPEEFPVARSILRGEVTQAKEAIYERPDGSRVHLLVSSKPINAADGRRIGGLLMLQDIGASSRAQ